MVLWASSMCFMHAASLPFFISAFDMPRCIVASFLGCFCRVIGGSCHYDKDVNDGDIGYIDNVDPDAGELNASFDGRWSDTALASSTPWYRPMPVLKWRRAGDEPRSCTHHALD